MIKIELWRVLPFVLGVLPQIAFVLLYSVPRFGAGQWWTDFTGRALFYKSTALAVLLSLSTVSLSLLLLSGVGHLTWSFSYTSTYRALLPGRWGDIIQVVDFTAAIFYWVLFGTIVYQLAALLHVRRAARRETRTA